MPYKDRAKQKDYQHKRYVHRKDEYLDRQRNARQAKRIWLYELKAKRGCDLCSESDPVCLDYHHRDSAHKVLALSRAAAKRWTETRMLEEIAKCDLLCANCHRKQHAKKHKYIQALVAQQIVATRS